MTWNIAQGRKSSIADISAFLKDFAPDVLALQEARGSQIRAISEATGLEAHHLGDGKAILCRGGHDPKHIDLVDGRWPRSMGIVHWGGLVLANVHLSYDPEIRARNMHEVRGVLSRHERSIALGDWNGPAPMWDGWEDLTVQSPTFPASAPQRRIDYILASPEMQMTWSAHTPDVLLSDHLPASATVTIH